MERKYGGLVHIDDLKSDSIEQHEKENLIGYEYVIKFESEFVMVEVADFSFDTGKYSVVGEYKGRSFNRPLYHSQVVKEFEFSKKEFKQKFEDQQWDKEFFGFKKSPSAVKTLNMRYRFDGEVLSMKQFIVLSLLDGATFRLSVDYKTEKEVIYLKNRDGGLSLLNATQYLFAKHVEENLDMVEDIINSWG